MTIVKLRSQASGAPADADGKAYRSHSLTVPREIAEVLMAADVLTFEPCITEDGVLFRPVKTITVKDPELPTWLKPAAAQA